MVPTITFSFFVYILDQTNTQHKKKQTQPIHTKKKSRFKQKKTSDPKKNPIQPQVYGA